MRFCSTWLRSLLCYMKNIVIDEFIIRVLHCKLSTRKHKLYCTAADNWALTNHLALTLSNQLAPYLSVQRTLTTTIIMYFSVTVFS